MSQGWLFVVSIVAGGVGALSGMGGGVILIPVLTLCGIDIKHAIALSVLSVVVISNSATPYYLRHHMPNLKVSGFLELYALIGAAIGSLGALAAPQRLLFVLCGSAFLISSAVLWRQGLGPWSKPRRLVVEQAAPAPQQSWQGSYYDEAEGHTLAYHGSHGAVAGPMMFVAAMAAGLLGIGSGAMTTLINTLVIGLPQKVSLTTTSLIIGVMALASAQVYLEAGFFDFHHLVPMIPGVMLGALIGSRLMVKLRNRTIQRMFVCVLVGLGIELLVRGL